MRFEESSIVELKRQVVEDIRKTVIAFANTNGGTIYVGVDDDGSIVGVKKIDEEMLKLTNAIRDSIKPDVTMFVAIDQIKIENKKIIKIEVQKGTESPYYLYSKGLRPEGVFVRQGSSTVPASNNFIRQKIKEIDGDTYEKMRSINQDLTFNFIQKEFKAQKIPFSNTSYKTLHLVNEDSIFTNLGLLLSDQNPHFIKAAIFEGQNKNIFKDRKEFSGPLLQQLHDAYAYIMQYNKIRSDFKGLYRNDLKDYPEEAIREALLNALVHRDYAFSSPLLISIFDDRIEIVSVGGLVKGIHISDIMLGISVTRNQGLAHIFYRLSLIEAYGIGIPKIFQAYTDFVNKPKLETSENAFKIVLPNQNAQISSSSLNDNEEKIIMLAKSQGAIKRKDVEDLLNISQTMAGRLIRNLVEQKILKQVGLGKNIEYIIL